MLSVEVSTISIALPTARHGAFASVAHADGGEKYFAVEPNTRFDRLQDAIATQPGGMAST